MKKYRARTKDGKIYGPLKLSGLIELYREGVVDKNSHFQAFPIGDWSTFHELSELKEIIENDITQTKTHVEDPSGGTGTEVLIPDDLTFDEATAPKVDDETLTKTIEEKSVAGFELEIGGVEDVSIEEKQERGDGNQVDTYNKDGLDKTIIKNKSAVDNSEGELDKTVIRILPEVENHERGIKLLNGTFMPMKKREENDTEKSDSKEDRSEPKVEEEQISTEEATLVINASDMDDLQNLMPILQQKKQMADIAEIDKEIKSVERKANKKKSKFLEAKDDLEYRYEEPDSVKKKKSMFVIIFLVFLFFYFDEEEKSVIQNTVRPTYSFPIQGPKNIKDSELDYKKGLAAYKKNTYIEKIKSSAFFFSSLTKNFEKNPALQDLILVYSDLLPMAKDKNKAAKIIYKLISLNRSKIFTNDKVALGAAQFYYHMGKTKTAVYIVESYLRLNKPRPRLYAFYLNLLIDEGRFEYAKKAYESLLSAKKSFFVIEALAKYLVMDQRVEDAIRLYQNNYKDFSNSMSFMASYGNLLVQVGDFKTLKGISAILISERGKGSPFLFAEGLKFAGYVLGAAGKSDEASKNFAASMLEHPSKEIKEMLSSLEVGGGEISEKIIKISKIDRLITQSKIEANKLDWDKAFFLALDAVDVDESSKKAKLYLASLQSKRGFLDEAELTLSRLLELYPHDENVNYEYLNTLIFSYKFKKVKEYLSLMTSENQLKNNADRYFSILAKYFYFQKKFPLAIKRYKEAIRANPIEEEYLFGLARVYCELNKFKSCRNYLNEARSLNPLDIDYKVLHSVTLFELEGLDVAIGYLLRELEEERNNPKLIGQIAILYYRNQNYKEYEEYRNKLESLTVKDEGLYRFLIETSKVEENFKMIVENAKKLLVINPGDIQVRMELARAYQGLGDNRSALKELSSVAKQLPTYPQISFEKARIYLEMGKLKIAEEEARIEIENSNSDYGYYILGKVLMRQKKFDEAEIELEKANAKNSKFFENLLELGYLKYRKREFAAARELYLRATSIDPASALLAKRMGDVFKEIGQATQAVEHYKKYIQLSPAASDRAQVESIIRQLQ